MPLHDFILPKSDTNSTVFDFLVIFCSFYVYSLVPGVWHLELLKKHLLVCSKAYVSMPSRAYTSFLPYVYRRIDHRYNCVNALSGLYLISTNTQGIAIEHAYDVSMPSRAYTSFLQCDRAGFEFWNPDVVSMPSRAYTSFLRR